MFKLKEINKICRKYSQDLWGDIIKKKKITKVLMYLVQLRQEKWLKYKPFFLDINSRKPLKRRKVKSRYGKNLDTLKKLSFFCGGLRRKKMKQILSIAQLQSGVVVDNFYYLMELRLSVIIYRMNFCNTILEAMHIIYAGYVLVNKEVIKQINYLVKIGDIIEISWVKRKQFFVKYGNKQKTKSLVLLQLHFLYINYELLMCIVIGDLYSGIMRYPFKLSKQYGYMLKKSKI